MSLLTNTLQNLSPSSTEASRVRWTDLPLRIKLVFPVVIFNCLVAISIFFAVWENSTVQLESRLQNDAELYAHTVRSATSTMKRRDELQSFLRTIGRKHRINFIALLDVPSRTILEATDPYTQRFPDVVIPFWRACLQQAQAEGTEAWIHFSKHQLQYVSPIAKGTDGALLDEFCVLIAMDTTKTRTQVFRGARRLALVTLVVLTAVSFAIISLLHFIVVKRINKVISATPRSADELLSYENPLDGLDELSRLSRSVTQAYRSLGGSFKRLRDFTDQLETTGKLANVGSWQIELSQEDVEQCPFHWCSQAQEVFGIQAEETTTLANLLRLFTNKSRPLVLSSFQAAATSGFPIDLDLPITTPEQEERWIRLVGDVQHLNGSPISISGAVQDITQHSTMLRSALSEARHQRSLLSFAGAGLWTWTPSSDALELSKEWRRRFKLPELSSLSEFMDFVHPDDRLALSQALSGQKPTKKFCVEFRIRGREDWAFAQWHGCASKRDRNGNTTLVSGLAIEISAMPAGV